MKTKNTSFLKAAGLLIGMIVFSSDTYAACTPTVGNYNGNSSCAKVLSITSNYCSYGIPGYQITITVTLNKSASLTGSAGGSTTIHSHSQSGNSHYFVVSSSDPNYVAFSAYVDSCQGNFGAISIDNN
jgi:hypothetical protein